MRLQGGAVFLELSGLKFSEGGVVIVGDSLTPDGSRLDVK